MNDSNSVFLESLGAVVVFLAIIGVLMGAGYLMHPSCNDQTPSGSTPTQEQPHE